MEAKAKVRKEPEKEEGKTEKVVVKGEALDPAITSAIPANANLVNLAGSFMRVLPVVLLRIMPRSRKQLLPNRNQQQRRQKKSKLKKQRRLRRSRSPLPKRRSKRKLNNGRFYANGSGRTSRAIEEKIAHSPMTRRSSIRTGNSLVKAKEEAKEAKEARERVQE